VAQNPAFNPAESPDGQYVYYLRYKQLWRARTDGSSPEIVRGMPELPYIGDDWFPFGSGIYFISHSRAKAAIEFFDLSSQGVRRVYELKNSATDYIGAMPVSSDGRWLFFPQLDEQSSNLMMIENWR